MKNFIYLLQGESKHVSNYFHLSERENSDAIFLTYDKPVKDAIYFPDSTWSEGRNKLLEAAKEKGEYLYYIFCDDDIEFVYGGWDEFEYYLLKYVPAIGCPVFPKTKKTKINFLNIQVFLLNDEQLMAFHRDVISDNLVIPYQTQFDKIHWWVPAGIQENLIQNFYRYFSLQFNRIEVLNKEHGRYDNSNKAVVRKYSYGWLSGEFKNGYKKILDTNKHRKPAKVKILIYTICFLLFGKLKAANYMVKKEWLFKTLNKDSLLLKQYKKRNV